MVVTIFQTRLLEVSYLENLHTDAKQQTNVTGSTLANTVSSTNIPSRMQKQYSFRHRKIPYYQRYRLSNMEGWGGGLELAKNISMGEGVLCTQCMAHWPIIY